MLGAISEGAVVAVGVLAAPRSARAGRRGCAALRTPTTPPLWPCPSAASPTPPPPPPPPHPFRPGRAGPRPAGDAWTSTSYLVAALVVAHTLALLYFVLKLSGTAAAPRAKAD